MSVPGRLSGALSLVPAGVTSVLFLALAWREQGSILAEDWLPYALGAGLLVATVLASGAALRPRSACLVGLGALAALAAWTALSASWSPVPALARDEALLALFYGLALAVPLLTLRSDRERIGAIAIVIAASASLVVATSVRLIAVDAPAELYWSMRLGSPMRYPGADTALFLTSFWPAAALAASRRLNPALRALALGGAVALLAGWLMTQSRAGAISLAVSAIVVFAFAPARLRLLVPVAAAGTLAGLSYYPLTDPFRERGADLEPAIRDAGTWALVLSLAGVVVGLAYAFADRRLALPPRIVRVAAVAAVTVLVLGAAGGVAAFAATVDAPADYVGDRWNEFKRQPATETGSSHLLTIGSNRYDFWRVAFDEFREHPLHGAGGRAFGHVYLREGRTDETPRRAHSLEFDLLSETGLIGLALTVAALAPFAWIVLRRARSDLVAAGVLGAAAYWLVHASGDWTWTFPAAALPFFLLLGAGAGGVDGLRIAPRPALATGLALGAVSLLLFAPPWLSSRYTAQALAQTAAGAEDELRWARRLDPLSTDPLIAEAQLASTPDEAVAPLRRAVEREPRSVAPRYLLGVAYLEAGRRGEARRQLREALRLAPRSVLVRQALDRARGTSR
jgi:O-antigen ligase/polysaccharide polymerase Wzy-like membrane protein/tetratricopeptide repeat protein